MKRSCFKGCFCSKAGFTLIELLVVVLIIGILAAVAVPQYQIAVAKSRYIQGMTLCDAVYKAQQVYYMVNNSYSKTFEDLDIELPTGGRKDTTDPNSEKIIYPNFMIANYNGILCEVYSKDPSEVEDRATLGASYHLYYNGTNKHCRAHKDDSLGNRVCKSIVGRNQIDTPGTINIYNMLK